MFKWTFLERENIVESRTGLHLSLHGLDVEIMTIKDWWSTYFKEQLKYVAAAKSALNKAKTDLLPWISVGFTHYWPIKSKENVWPFLFVFLGTWLGFLSCITIFFIVLLDAMEQNRPSPSAMAGCLGEEAAWERQLRGVITNLWSPLSQHLDQVETNGDQFWILRYFLFLEMSIN